MLTFANEEMNDIMKLLEEPDVLIKDASKTIKDELKMNSRKFVRKSN